MDSENLRRHSSFYTLGVAMSLAFHYIADILWGDQRAEWDVGSRGRQRKGEKKGKNREGWSEKVKSPLFLCPAPVTRPLQPPTRQPRALGKSWRTSTKALCVRACVFLLVCYHMHMLACILWTCVLIYVSEDGCCFYTGCKNSSLELWNQLCSQSLLAWWIVLLVSVSVL